MVKQKLFTSTIYQRGMDYYRKGKVIQLNASQNRYRAIVKGTNHYHVYIEYNSNREVLYMECDCPYAVDGYHCKHEAALYIKIENEREMQIVEDMEVSKLSLTEAYLVFSSNYRNARVTHRLFLNELNKRFEQINNDAEVYSSSYFSQVIKLLKEVDELSYDRKYKETVYDEFIEEFQTLIHLNDAYLQDVLSWIKKDIIDGGHLFYPQFLTYFIDTIPTEELIKEVKDLLLHMRYTDAQIQNHLLECIYYALKDSDDSVSVLLNDLKRFADREMYQRIKIENLIYKKDYPSAYKCIRAFKKNHKFIDDQTFDFLEEDIYYHVKDKEAYQNTIIHMIHTYNDIDDFMYIDKLKSMYEDEWTNACYDFYDKLFIGIGENFIQDILENQDEIQYIVLYVMQHLTSNNIRRYKDIIKKYDNSMYHYLLTLLILEESRQAKSQSKYYQILHYLNELINDQGSFQSIDEIRYLIERENPNKKALHDILADFVNGEDGELFYDENIL